MNIQPKTVFIGLTFMAMAGCAGLPETSRSGDIQDVTFQEEMTPATLRVQPGDEVRWLNQRTASVTLEFLEQDLDDVTCAEGFSNMLGQVQPTITLDQNETASLCFGSTGTIDYNARMETGTVGGEIESGRIIVGGDQFQSDR